MEVEYNRDVLHELAERLYRRAALVEIIGALRWGAIAAVIGYLAGSAPTAMFYLWRATGYRISGFRLALILAVIFGAIGWWLAGFKALMLRAEAQKLLCAIEVEKSSRTLRDRVSV